jgi:hypothetical protein
MRTIRSQILVPVFVGCFAFSQITQAVIPPPDGGYPGGNTAEGQNALFSHTSGGFNTGVGFLSLRSNTTGSFNTATGAGTLLANTGDRNTATGAGALLSNTTGTQNTANGALALFSNTEGTLNTANGESALFSNTTGSFNTANGFGALFSNTTGRFNTANGSDALNRNTAGDSNTATGTSAMQENTIGIQNTADGGAALASNTVGTNNTATGFQALRNNTTGGFNTAGGINALVNNASGSSNTALGDSAGFGVTTADHVICIGANVQGENVSNTCYIGNIFGVTSTGGAGVFVNADGKLGTITSSVRFKEKIEPMDGASEVLHALKPVTYRYKKEIDPHGRSQFGLVAEDVEKVHPDLVVRDKAGKPYSVRYDQVNAMLLNEFLKEHRTVLELKEEIAALAATVKEQAAQIQKVCAQMEMSKPGAQVAVKNR